MFLIDINLLRYLGKAYCVRKCKKLGIENLIIVATTTGQVTSFTARVDRHQYIIDFRPILSKYILFFRPREIEKDLGPHIPI